MKKIQNFRILLFALSLIFCVGCYSIEPVSYKPKLISKEKLKQVFDELITDLGNRQHSCWPGGVGGPGRKVIELIKCEYPNGLYFVWEYTKYRTIGYGKSRRKLSSQEIKSLNIDLNLIKRYALFRVNSGGTFQFDFIRIHFMDTKAVLDLKIYRLTLLKKFNDYLYSISHYANSSNDLSETKKCPKCSHVNKAIALFCSNCGAKLK